MNLSAHEVGAYLVAIGTISIRDETYPTVSAMKTERIINLLMVDGVAYERATEIAAFGWDAVIKQISDKNSIFDFEKERQP